MDRPATTGRGTPANDASAPAPEYGSLAAFTATFNLSRATAYRGEQLGWWRFVKVGGKTLVDFASVRRHLASLTFRKEA